MTNLFPDIVPGVTTGSIAASVLNALGRSDESAIKIVSGSGVLSTESGYYKEGTLVLAKDSGKFWLFSGGSFVDSGSVISTISGIAGSSVMSDTGGSVVKHNTSTITTGSYTQVQFDDFGHAVSGSAVDYLTSVTIAGSSVMSDTGGSVVKHNTSGVVSGSYNQVEVNDFGHVTSGSIIMFSYPMDGRLTLGSGSPVTTTDITNASTLYLTPYNGDKISLYNGSSWSIYTLPEINISLATGGSSLPHDVFCYVNSSNPTLEFTQWTSGSVRATNLAYQNGILVKSGSATRRYIGTIYVNASGSQCSDNVLNRFVWNYYNQAERPFNIIETTANWAYGTQAWRPWNNSTANRVNFIIGVAESQVELQFVCVVKAPSAGSVGVGGIALDATNTSNSMLLGAVSTADPVPGIAIYKGYLTGFHYLQLTEFSYGANATFYGITDDIVIYHRSGAVGKLYG